VNIPEKTPAQLEYEALNKTNVTSWILFVLATGLCTIVLAFLSIAYVAAKLTA
jgi:phage terminase large subunit-like protein